ncbi:centrosomal protein of 164 kDa isoform X3 [Oxyura jamaicensis]|uniref:centrosomal protein of 164 kDa isoform X3 n=1 Tax=Oxyura jamaicensis TaxID=8884 RepID=UPI0015A5B06A|nr:centrosomal protein of 164 kDa isoform X3 [Oxyura jamaicensis]
MAGAMVRIGDQLILEEDYDETYIPSEQEIRDFARDIGIDPEKEPELMWLAKEGIVAPLPPEWKPCQDITGDIYYFNFANGQSTWDHPCDDHYRELVTQERKKLLARGGLKKKEKKKKDKKEKKDKKDKQSLKQPTEMQPGILPSTAFCQIPCAILSPGQESPEPEPDSQIRKEGLFDKGKGRASCVSDSWRQFAYLWPDNLHPILVSEFSRPCQTLTDAVNILETSPPFGSFDADIHQERGIPLAIQESLCSSSSDSQSDDVEVRPTVQPLHVLKKSCSLDFENVKTPPESPEDKILLFDEKLKGKQKIKDVMDDCVRKSDHPFSAGEKSTGPGGGVKRSPSLLQAREERFYCRNLEMTLFDASATNDWGLQETADAPHAREELSSHSRVSQSRSKRKVQGGEALAQAISLYKSNESSSRPEREGSKQMELTKLGVDTEVDSTNGVLESLPTAPEEIMGARHCFQGTEAKGGSDVDLHSAVPPTSKHVFSSAKGGCNDDERGGLMSECDSSDLDSSQNENAPQIRGASSLHNDSGRSEDVYSVTEEPRLPCPILGSSLSQILAPAEKPERECSSKDTKLCHTLQECEAGASPEPDCVNFLVDSCGKCTAQESNSAGVQTEVNEENGRTDQAPGAWGHKVAEELQVPPEYLRQMADCWGSTSLCRHVEVEMTQTRQTAENCSKIEVGEGAGGNEPSGSPLAPVQAPLGNLAPLRGPVASPAGILRGSLNSDVGSSVDSSLAARGETRPAEPCKPTGHTKKLLGLVCEEKSSLNTVALDKGRNEEEESENESLRGTRLFKNLHMDVSALGGSFESEENSKAEEENFGSRLATEARLQHQRSPAEEAGSLREESLKSRHAEEGQESSLDADDACPPTPGKVLSGDADCGLSGQNKEDSDGKLTGNELLGEKDAEVEGDVSAADELPRSLEERRAPGTDVPGSPVQPRAASPDAEAAEADQLASLAVTVDTVSVDENIVNEMREEAADLKTDSRLDAGKLSKASETSECVEDLQASNRSDHELIQHMDLAFQSRFSEQVLDVGVLSPVLDGPMCKAQELGEEEKDQSKASIEEEQSKRTKAAESERDQSGCETSGQKCVALENPKQEEVVALELAEGSLDSLINLEELAAPQKEQPEKEIKQEQSLSQPSEESLEGIAKELEKEIEQEKMHLLQAKEEKIQQFQEEMRQQEEEEAQKLHQQKEKSLRTLKEDLAKVSEEEELRVRKEETERLSKLRAKIASETEAEEEKIRAEQEFMLQKLREEWESLQVTEKKNLERKKQLVLEKMKLEMEEAQQKEMVRLEQEKEQFLRELKERLETEKRKATEELEKQFATEFQQLKSAAEEKHQKAISSLQTQAAEAQRSKETWLHEDLQRAEQKMQQKAYQVMAYEHELSELMREKRQGVEKDHERKMERMKEEHQEVLARIQDQYEEEERKQRAELLEGLRSEMARLRQLHEVEVKALQAELDERLTLLQNRHREKERKLQDSENELEIRAKNVKARSAQLLSQEESLRKKRQQLLDEDRRTELERDEAALASQLRLEENRKEHTSLLESIRQLRRALEELQDQKAELEAQVDLLQTRSQRLQKRISELEAAVRSKQEVLKELEAEESVESPRKKSELHVEDLRETIQAHSSREPASPPSQSHEDSNLQFDHVRSYISAEGISIRNAKEFLVRQTRSMRKRHTALKAAKQRWHQDMQKAQEVVQDLDSSQLLEGVRKNLEEEAKQLDKMKSVMRKGQVLLKKKEEKLSQLESSLLEELSDEDTLKSTAYKKMVTFDLSNSEDTNSVSSASLGQPKFDLRTDLQVGPQLDKIQYLTDSLQLITRELNGVLGVLSSLNNRQSPLFTSTQVPSNGVPLSTYASLAGLQAGGSVVPPAGVSLVDQWVRSTGLSSSRSFTAGQTVDSILAEKWHKYFPGGFPSLSGSSGTLDNKLGYVPAGEQVRLFQHSQFQSCESDKMSIQGMIETNKKWLEDFKRDSKVPLFPGAQKPPASSPSLLQLGLDENRQIKVYHY